MTSGSVVVLSVKLYYGNFSRSDLVFMKTLVV